MSHSNGQYKFERLTQDHNVEMTQDHNVEMPQEAERIANAEGTIVNGRIDGIIETTRCFGCHRMKSNESLASNEQKMICVPEVTKCCGKNADRLLIFSDGLIKKWSDGAVNTTCCGWRCKHHVLQNLGNDLASDDTAFVSAAEANEMKLESKYMIQRILTKATKNRE
eukprot:271263_1